MARILVGTFTKTGLERLLAVPSPSWPKRLAPQARTVPSALNASEWEIPMAVEVTSASPLIASGVACMEVVPSPSCPYQLAPHAYTLPSDFRKMTWFFNATPKLDGPSTATGGVTLPGQARVLPFPT